MSIIKFVECTGPPKGVCKSEDKVSPNEGQLPGEVISQPGTTAQSRKSSNMAPIASETVFGDVPTLKYVHDVINKSLPRQLSVNTELSGKSYSHFKAICNNFFTV